MVFWGGFKLMVKWSTTFFFNQVHGFSMWMNSCWILGNLEFQFLSHKIWIDPPWSFSSFVDITSTIEGYKIHIISHPILVCVEIGTPKITLWQTNIAMEYRHFCIGNTSSIRVHFPASYVRLPKCNLKAVDLFMAGRCFFLMDSNLVKRAFKNYIPRDTKSLPLWG